MAVKIVVIGLYALLIIVVGLLGLRKTKTFSDFFLGGGNVGPWMTAFTYATAYFSAVLFVGFAGKIGWGFGYSSLWIAIGNAFVGVLAVWWLLGHRIKRLSVAYNAHTMPEFLQKRYDSQLLKLFSAVAIFVFMVPYCAAVFMGLSYLFESNLEGVEYNHVLVGIGLFTAIYLVLGGYKSMTMIDVIFGIIMIAGVLVLAFSLLSKGGGLSGITARLDAINPKLTGTVGPPGWWPLFCLVFLTSVAPFGMPQLMQKFYAIKDRRAVHIGMVASTTFALLIGCIAYFAGSTTRAFLTPDATPAAFDPESGAPVFDRLMPELLANVVPASLSVLMLLLVLAASMSTLAALVLISSSSVVKDFYAGYVNRNASDQQLTLLMRIASAVFVALSVIMAAAQWETIVAILGISWGAIGAVFLGPFVWGAFTQWTNKYGAIGSSVIALGVCIALYVHWDLSSPEAGTIGMMVSLAANPVISLITRPLAPSRPQPPAVS
jgi:SSS family solute:Na+ symporter